MMTTIKVNPTRRVAHAPVQKFVQDFFSGSLADVAGRDFVHARPAVNVLEKEDGFELFLAAPGLSKDRFSIEVKDDVLVIAAEQNETDADAEVDYKRREFDYNGFKRSFKLHPMLDVAKISAKYDAGILTVMIPKLEKQVRQIEIR